MAKKTGLTINITSDNIKGVEVVKSGDYRYARLGARMSDDEYISISIEWKGESIPDAVMSMMEYIKANQDEVVMDESCLEEFKSRLKEL